MVVFDIVGRRVEKVGSGGGRKEGNSGEVVEEESSIITKVVGEGKVKWTEMSMVGGDKMGKALEVEGGGVVTTVTAVVEVVGSECN